MANELYTLQGTKGWTSPGRSPIGATTTTPVDPNPPVTPVDPTLDPVPPQSRQLPDYPSVKWSSLYVAGDTVQQTLARLNDWKVIEMPSDEILFEFSDFTMASANFGLFRSYCLGFIGQGRNGTRFRIKPNSSTQVAKVPVQTTGQSNPLTFARVGQSGVNYQQIVANLSMIGTDQPPSANNGGKPHDYSGLLNYYGVNSIYQNLFIQGMPGDYNYPPGETFQLNDYKGIGTIYRDIEVSGWNEAGTTRVGGSPFGHNGSVNSYMEDCYFHDSRVSSLTYGMAGSATTGTSSASGTTRRLKIERNANHVEASGQGFSCINHEGASGKFLHAYPTLYLGTGVGDATMQWDDSHVTMSSNRENCTMTIDHVAWKGGYTLYNGAFVVKMPKNYNGIANSQTTPPVVIDSQGRTLAPYVITAAPKSLLPIDITKQYILNQA